MSGRDLSFDWDSMIAGGPVPGLPIRLLVPALWSAFGVARAFDRGGLSLSLARLNRITPGRTMPVHLPSATRLFLAREIVFRVRGPIRVRYGLRLCLFETLAATAALRAIGLPAYAVVGYATGFGSPETPVHAWASLDGKPVSDMPYIWQRFTEIVRYPDDAGARSETSCGSTAG